MNASSVFDKASRKLNEALIRELRAQGHSNTGGLERSFDTKADKNGVVGFAFDYAGILNEGYPAASASMKQLPFLIQYFISKGHSPKDAKGIAAATIRTWMKTGMPSQGGKRFSQTGERSNFVESVQKNQIKDIDGIVLKGLDNIIQEKFKQTKSGKL